MISTILESVWTIWLSPTLTLMNLNLLYPIYSRHSKMLRRQRIYILKESIMIHFAETYQQIGEFEKILYYAEEGLKLARDLEDISGEATAYLKLGYYYLYRNRMSMALKYAHLSENAATSVNLREQLANAYLLQGQISFANKEYFASQEYQSKHDSIEILTVNERILNNIQELDAKYETEKKVQQINQLEHDRAIQELRLQTKQINVNHSGRNHFHHSYDKHLVQFEVTGKNN